MYGKGYGMALSDSLEKFIFDNNSVCPVGVLITKLNKEDADALRKALDGEVSAITIRHALRQEGHKIGEPSLNDHRKGRCRCVMK